MDIYVRTSKPDVQDTQLEMKSQPIEDSKFTITSEHLMEG